MLKKFIPQKPTPSIPERSFNSDADENNRVAYRDEPRTLPPSTNHQKTMTEHSGKDVLSSDVEIKGSIKFQKELLIDGKVEGEINSDGVLTIGENADIRGEVKTKSITVYGKVHGNITVAERCELKSKCTLQGDLKAARLANPKSQAERSLQSRRRAVRKLCGMTNRSRRPLEGANKERVLA